MRAVRLERFGGPEVLRVVTVDRPSPAAGEVLVRVVAAGVNPVDWKVRASGGSGRFSSPPLVLGWDLSGVVEEVGDGVPAFAAGDEVFGMPRFPERSPSSRCCRWSRRPGHTSSASAAAAGASSSCPSPPERPALQGVVRPSSRAALSFRIFGRTAGLTSSWSKSASQRSGVISGKSEPNSTLSCSSELA